MKREQRGFVLLEVTIALVVLAMLMSWAATGSSSQLRHAGACFEQTRAERLAAGRLETLRSETVPLAVGESGFPIAAALGAGLTDVAAEQAVREIEPGLFEVAVTVSWGAQRQRSRSRLVTLIERRTD